MDELYTTTTGTIGVNYEQEDNEHLEDINRKYYREFDYGIDTTDNVILIQDEIE